MSVPENHHDDERENNQRHQRANHTHQRQQQRVEQPDAFLFQFGEEQFEAVLQDVAKRRQHPFEGGKQATFGLIGFSHDFIGVRPARQSVILCQMPRLPQSR